MTFTAFTTRLEAGARRALLELNRRLGLLEAEVETGSYVPTLSGFAIGTGGGAENTATYTYSNGILAVQGFFLFGTSGTTFPGATITVSLPPGFNLVSVGTTILPVGEWAGLLTGGTFRGGLRYNTATDARLVTWVTTSPNYVRDGATSTTAPATWKAGDYVAWTLSARVVRV